MRTPPPRRPAPTDRYLLGDRDKALATARVSGGVRDRVGDCVSNLYTISCNTLHSFRKCVDVHEQVANGDDLTPSKAFLQGIGTEAEDKPQGIGPSGPSAAPRAEECGTVTCAYAPVATGSPAVFDPGVFLCARPTIDVRQLTFRLHKRVSERLHKLCTEVCTNIVERLHKPSINRVAAVR